MAGMFANNENKMMFFTTEVKEFFHRVSQNSFNSVKNLCVTLWFIS